MRTPAEARMMARSLLRQGVDGLKVYQHLTPDLLKPIVEEAHKAGTEAVGHSRDAREAILSGLKFIEHATPIAHATLGDPVKIKAMDENRLRTPEADTDIILIDGDPLADIRATRKIRTVTMNGKTLDTTLDPNFRNPIRRPIAEYDMDKTP